MYMLEEWPQWAAGQRQKKTAAEKILCSGPDSQGQLVDQARFGPVQNVGHHIENHKKAKNSIVVIDKQGAGHEVGRVQWFTSHAPPGWNHERDQDQSQQHIADVH